MSLESIATSSMGLSWREFLVKFTAQKTIIIQLSTELEKDFSDDDILEVKDNQANIKRKLSHLHITETMGKIENTKNN